MNVRVRLTRPEVRAIRRGLKRLAYETRKNIERADAKGWQPEPGCHDMSRETMKVVTGLLDRLPFPDYPVDTGNPAGTTEEHSS